MSQSISSIPKTIHYCWFGGKPLPDLAVKCIESWKRFCPDYEIVRWDESNFDVNSCAYVKEAYEAQKWAFVSDYARFWILYNHGGIYFDTDVELIKPIDHIVEKGAFMGIESSPGDYVGSNDNSLIVAPGLGLGAEKNCSFYSKVLSYYKDIHFVYKDGKQNTLTVGEHVTALLVKEGLEQKNVFQCIKGINIWPKEYFNPMDANSGRLIITDNTVSVHHYAGTWVDSKIKVRDSWFRLIYRTFGEKTAAKLKKLYRRLFN